MRISFPALIWGVLLPLLSALLLAGCCGSTECDCQSERADALAFRFDSSFTAAQVDTVLLIRSVYPRDTSTTTAAGTTYARPDTALVVRSQATALLTPLYIDNTTPFAVANGRKVGYANPDSSYRYTIIVREPARRRRGPILARYYIGRVRLRGQYEADGCCSCYRNKEKQFTLNSFRGTTLLSTQLIDAHTAPGEPLIVTTLRR